MHSDWKRLALIAVSIAVALALVTNLSARKSSKVTVVQIRSALVGATGPWTGTDSLSGDGYAEISCAVSAPRVQPVDLAPVSAACVPLPLVLSGSVVRDDGVVVSTTTQQCLSVPWCPSVDSLTRSEATCSDGSTGRVTRAVYAPMPGTGTTVWPTLDSVPAATGPIAVTVTCVGRCYAVSASGERLAEFWELPDGSGMFAVTTSLARNCTSAGYTGLVNGGSCTVHGAVKRSTVPALPRPCVLNATNAASVPVSVVQLRPGVLVVASTWDGGNTSIGVLGWYHQPRFSTTRVAAVCGTLVDPRTPLSGSMAFSGVACNTRRFSMVLLTDRQPALFGRTVSIVHSTSACANDTVIRGIGSYAAAPWEPSVSAADLNGMHRIVGDTYYLRMLGTGRETIVRDTDGLPRALLPASGGCVLVDGWQPDATFAAAGYTTYDACASVSGLCYPVLTVVNISSPLVSAPTRLVAAGGALFDLPWPPLAAATLGVGAPSAGIVRAVAPADFGTEDGIQSGMFTEMCGAARVSYVNPAHPLLETHFSPTGSVDPAGVGLVPRMWINATAVPQQLSASCGMLLLWSIQGATVASPTPPSAILRGAFTCTATSRCASTGAETPSQNTLVINGGAIGPVYLGGTVTCVPSQ